MAALGDKSGTADDHAPYPLHSAWVQVWRSRKDLIVRREVDSGPPLRQAWAGPEIPFSYPINWRLRFFSQALNFL